MMPTRSPGAIQHDVSHDETMTDTATPEQTEATREGDDTDTRDIDDIIDRVCQVIDDNGFAHAVETDERLEFFAELKRDRDADWKALRRAVRKHCKGNGDLPNVGDVDQWARDVTKREARNTAEAVNGEALTFDVGDAAEVSRQLQQDIQGNGHRLVFDYEKFHQYNPDTGLWEVVPREALSRQVQEYSGAVDLSASEPRPLKVSGSKVDDAIDLFRDRIHEGATTEDETGFFDAAPRGLMFDNGFLRVDLEAGSVELEPADPSEHRARIGAGVPYNPKAEAPMFDDYMRSVFEGDPDAEGKRKLLLEFCGACLLGMAPEFERALVLYDNTDRSGGANGKSVLIKLLQTAFVRSATSSVKPQQFDAKFANAELAGSRINFATELPENDILASDTLKGVITGDPMQAERKYGDPFQFQPKAGHIFGANEFPRVVATDDAFWRRWIVVPFNRRFTPKGEPGADRITALDERIIDNGELPGVLARMVEGAKRLLAQNAYTDVPSAEQAKREWRRQSNPIQQFLIDETTNYQQAGPVYDQSADWKSTPGRHTPARDLYKAYTAWAKATGHSAVSLTKFGRRISKLVEKGRTSSGSCYRVQLKDRTDRVGNPESATGSM